MPVRAWLTANQTWISPLGNICTAISAITAAVGVWIAAEQLKSASLSLQASTAFQVSQEGRAVARAYLENPSGNVGFVMSFIHTAWYQNRIGALAGPLWTPIEEETCAFLMNSDLTNYWTDSRKKQFNADFVTFIDNMRKKCK